jgi:hypothetical protein
VRWLNVHPEYVVSDESWGVIRLASNWREGTLPGAGGVQDQSAWTVEAVETVLTAWAKLRDARDKKK